MFRCGDRVKSGGRIGLKGTVVAHSKKVGYIVRFEGGELRAISAMITKPVKL